VTRGAGAVGLAFEPEAPSRLVVIVAPARRPDGAAFERGLRVALVSRLRISARALDPGAKTGNYLNNVLALHEARLAGADDAVMLNARGEVTEATTANVYLVTGTRLRTPPLEAGILKGTTRTRVLALAEAAGLLPEQEVVLPEDLLAADEVFLSSSVRGVLGVVSVDGAVVGAGGVGPSTRRLRLLFEQAADDEARAFRGGQA
jgi:branched-chain amino acid aminotransferase